MKIDLNRYASRHFIAILGLVLFQSEISFGKIQPEKVHVADNKKTDAYIQEGLIVGGDRAIDEVIIKDIRWANDKNHERIVLDLEGNKNGEPAAIARPPYFQVSSTSSEKKLVISIWGHPQLNFAMKKLQTAFKRSVFIKELVLFPKLEENLWTFAIELKTPVVIETFELTNPVRIILDIQRNRKLTESIHDNV